MRSRWLALAAAALLPAVAFAGDRVPGALVAGWYAGAGGTSAPVNPTTGAVGPANGKGLLYEFHADGSYVKAFHSSVSNGGCTTQLSAVESGALAVKGDVLTLTPSKGTVSFRSSCAPSMDSDKPNDDLHAETLTYAFVDGALRLANPSGASSVFRRVK
jgi:hypothetical protein